MVSDERDNSSSNWQDGGGVEIAPGVFVSGDVLRFSYMRSSGPGGQNVNKVNTKAELRLSIEDLVAPGGPLSQETGRRLVKIAGRGRVTTEGELILVSDEHRTQRRNRAECLLRLRVMIVEAQRRPKVRRKTRPTRGAVERRLKEKKSRGVIKRGRGKVGGGDGGEV